ncbi:MAG: hypothetical protein L0216_20865 [Planctomycetales bacterium]|nr:hypothetical protein [Planctomycetales bacterium]
MSAARRGGHDRVRLDTARPFQELVSWYERQCYRVVDEVQWKVTNYPSVILEKSLRAHTGSRP